MAVTETFLDGSVEDSELVSGDWNILRRDRRTPCGGVALAARAPIVLQRCSDLETVTGEDLWCRVECLGRQFYVCVVYIKPTATDGDYMQWFCKIENCINELKAPVIILGDINLNSANVTIHNYYCYFLSYCNMSERNMVINSHGGILDVVLVRESNVVREVNVTATDGIVPPDAYHPPLDVVVKINVGCNSDALEPSNIDPAQDWNFNKCDYERLLSLLLECSWDAVLREKDVFTATDRLYSIVYGHFNDCMPKKIRKSKISKRYPVWFSTDIIQDIRQKSKLHAQWKRTNSHDAYMLFSKLRADLKHRTAAAYSLHIKRIEGKIQSNPGEFWQHISNLRTKGGFEPKVTFKGKAFSGIDAAEAFAGFFSSVFLPEIPQLNAELAGDSDSSCDSKYVNIFQITQKDVLEGINKLKPGSSMGPDGFPSVVLKLVSESLCIPLCHIYNVALDSGRYPPQWKLSRVSPIPKSSDRSRVEEYRPIAVLSSPAKVFENIIHKHIFTQVDKYLCNEQHGFRPKRSIETNLLTLVDYISTKLDRGSQVDVLYFDFRKAFDRVNNDVLLEKLCSLGFAPKLLRLLADYMRDRQQFVRLGLYESEPYHTRSGVSQGSILGPLLFLLMVNDLPDVLGGSQCLLYADDLKLFREVNSVSDCAALQRDVDEVCQWGDRNGMEFNTAKCFAMTFTRMRQPIICDYTVNGNLITRVTNMKDLGVTFDRELTFHDHIVALAKESFRRLGFILRNSKDFQNFHVIRLMFASLIRSKLESAMCVWNPHESKYILMLEKVQKAFLRYLYKRINGYYPYMYPTKFLLGCLGYNSLEVRRERHQMVVMCKILRGKIDAPDLHGDLLRLFTPDKYTRSRRHSLLAVPPCRTVARSQSPIPRSLSALNALLDANPDFDLFADSWTKILCESLRWCEINV